MSSEELSQLPAGAPPAGQDLFYSAQFDSATQTFVAVSVTGQQIRTWSSRPNQTTGAVLFQNPDGYMAGATGLSWDDIDGLLLVSNPLSLSPGTALAPSLTFGYSAPGIPIQHGFYQSDNSTIACIPKATVTNNQLQFGVLSGVSFMLADVCALSYVNFDAFFQRVAQGVARIADTITGAGTYGFFQTTGQKRVSTQFDKTTDAALANITGLSVNVAAGRTYQFQAVLFTASGAGGGVQAAVAGTCTATAIIYEGQTTNAAASVQTRATALATAVGGVTAVTAARIDICGTITVNAAGTLTIQFAQNVSNGTASSVLVGSYMLVQDMP